MTLISRLERLGPGMSQATKMIRESLGLNQQDFAQLIGISKPQLARVERGEANPTQDTLEAIGKPFGLVLGFVRANRSALPDDTVPSPQARSSSDWERIRLATAESNFDTARHSAR